MSSFDWFRQYVPTDLSGISSTAARKQTSWLVEMTCTGDLKGGGLWQVNNFQSGDARLNTVNKGARSTWKNSYFVSCFSRSQWLRSRTSDFRHGFESCAAVLKPWASFFTLHCSSSLSCINEYMATDSGGYVYEQPSRINCSIWLDVSQRSWDVIFWWLKLIIKPKLYL